MRASPNEVPLSAADSSRPLSGLLVPATPWKSLLVEMYGPRHCPRAEGPGQEPGRGLLDGWQRVQDPGRRLTLPLLS